MSFWIWLLIAFGAWCAASFLLGLLVARVFAINVNRALPLVDLRPDFDDVSFDWPERPAA